MNRQRVSLSRVIGNGLVIIAPILLLGVVIEVMYGILAGWLSPVLNALPGKVLQSEVSRFIAVIVALAVLALLVGGLATTRWGLRAGNWVEVRILRRVPFYNALQLVVAGLSGRRGAQAVQAVLVTVDEPGLQQFGIRMEILADGRSAIFLPGSPNPGSGSVVVVTPDRVQELDMPAREVVRCLSRWGNGSSTLLQPPGDDLPGKADAQEKGGGGARAT